MLKTIYITGKYSQNIQKGLKMHYHQIESDKIWPTEIRLNF